MFQSLAGFPMSCNGGADGLRNHRRRGFQSLSGFPMSCNTASTRTRLRSVPFQSLSGFPMSCNHFVTSDEWYPFDMRVSIPIGFSNELQRKRRTATRGCPPGFQSLSGFPMSCNWAPVDSPTCSKQVSIPIGFSNELQHRCNGSSVPCEISSFNPYRVFQ